jgi:hypothetical protein
MCWNVGTLRQLPVAAVLSPGVTRQIFPKYKMSNKKHDP